MVSILGSLIREAREQRRLTRAEVAVQSKKGEQWIYQIEKGGRVPPLATVVELYAAIYQGHSQPSDGTLASWLLAWLQEQIAQLGQVDGLELDPKEVIGHAVQMGSWDRSAPAIDSSAGRTLRGFPYGEPLTVICGDRREASPKNRGDIFAYSGSITDVMFLPRLGLDKSVTIRSDKLFVVMQEDYLRRQFGETNLLVIGSPAVNFATRAINNYSIFRFSLADEMRAWEDQLRSLKLLNDRKHLIAFWRIAQNLEPDEESRSVSLEPEQLDEITSLCSKVLDGESPKDLMNRFRTPGFIDPADKRLQSRSTRSDNDFGVISIARNPFAPRDSKYVCVMAGGIHGPGTAQALKALAEDDFDKHPYGGILEVEIDLDGKDWPTRFQEASWEWQTREYTHAKLEENLEELLSDETASQRGWARHLSREEIVDALALIRTLAGATSTKPSQDGAASSGAQPMGGAEPR